MRRIPVDPPGASGLAFTRAGDVLAAVSFDNLVYFWDLATGKRIGRIDAKPIRIHSFALSADGKKVFLVPEPSKDLAVIHGYEVPGGKEIGAYGSVHSYVTGVAAAADGKRLASWGNSFNPAPANQAEQSKLARTVQIWDTQSGKELWRVLTDRDFVSTAAFSPDGKILVWPPRGAIQFWDAAGGKLVRSFQGRLAYGLSLTFAPDGRTLYAVGGDGKVQAWEVESGRRLSLAGGQPGRVCSLAFPPGGPALACSQDGQELIVWEVASGKAAAPLRGPRRRRRRGRLRARRENAAVGGRRRRPAAVGRRRGQAARPPRRDLRRNRLPAARYAPLVLFLPRRPISAGAARTGGECAKRPADGRCWRSPPRRSWGRGMGRPRAFAPDGSVVAVAEGPGPPAAGPGVQIWDAASGRRLFRLKDYKGLAAALAISADGKRLALALFKNPPGPGEWNEIMAWPLVEGKEPRSLKRYGRPGQGVISLAFSPDGRVLAAADNSGGLAVWDAATGEDRWQAPPANEYALAAAVFSPDGRLLAAATHGPQSEDGIIRIYEVSSGKVRRQCAGASAR